MDEDEEDDEDESAEQKKNSKCKTEEERRKEEYGAEDDIEYVDLHFTALLICRNMLEYSNKTGFSFRELLTVIV